MRTYARDDKKPLHFAGALWVAVTGIALQFAALPTLATGVAHPCPQAVDDSGTIKPNPLSQAQRSAAVVDDVSDWTSQYVRRSSGVTSGDGNDCRDSRDGGSSGNAVYSQNFEALSADSAWLGMPDTEVRNGCGVNGSKCLRVTYRPASNGSPRIQASCPLPPAMDYTLNYDIYFESGFEFVKGGKLPGLAPKRPVTGCKAPVPKGWSVRVMWRPEGRAQAYFYDQQQDHDEQQNRVCGKGLVSQNIPFQVGQWHAVSVRVKVNSGANTSDGLVQLYVDGAPVVDEQHNLRLRGKVGPDSEIAKLFFSTFYGGDDASWAPPKTTHVRFDNFSVYSGLRVRTTPGQ